MLFYWYKGKGDKQQTRIYDKHSIVNCKHDEREVQPGVPKKGHKRKHLGTNFVIAISKKIIVKVAHLIKWIFTEVGFTI